MFVLVLLALIWIGNGSEVFAQNNLWMQRDPSFVNPFADVKARRPGDLLIVQINERSNVQNRDQRLMQKQNLAISEGSLGGGITGSIGNAASGLNFDQENQANRRFAGDSQFRSERGFIDQFTVTVVDITPNGNLLITGRRHVALEGDERTLVLTGMVRAADITPNNMIPSSKVSNLDIRYETAGEQNQERRFINQGWLGRRFNKIWPY